MSTLCIKTLLHFEMAKKKHKFMRHIQRRYLLLEAISQLPMVAFHGFNSFFTSIFFLCVLMSNLLLFLCGLVIDYFLTVCILNETFYKTNDQSYHLYYCFGRSTFWHYVRFVSVRSFFRFFFLSRSNLFPIHLLETALYFTHSFVFLTIHFFHFLFLFFVLFIA